MPFKTLQQAPESDFEQILSGLEKFSEKYKENEDRRTKKESEKIDTYMNMRKAGYTKEEAYEQIKKRYPDFQKPSGEYMDLDRASKQADIKLKDARTAYYKDKVDEDDDQIDTSGGKGTKPKRESKIFKAIGDKARSAKEGFTDWFSNLGKEKDEQQKASKIVSPEMQSEKAKMFLQSKGYRATDEEVATFLRNNPEFK